MKTIVGMAAGGVVGFLSFVACLQLGLQSQFQSTLRFVLVGTGAAAGAAAGAATTAIARKEQASAAHRVFEDKFRLLEAEYSKSQDQAGLVALYQLREKVDD
jgi:hypothetical protein